MNIHISNRCFMKNNKLFKDKISESLYDNVFDFFKKLHHEKKETEELDHTIKTKAKIHNVIGAVAGTVGLVTIGMAISQNYELYTISPDIIKTGGYASLAMSFIYTGMHRSIETLREEFRSRLTTGPLQDMGTFSKFEEKLVMDLNKAGIQVYSQHISDYDEFKEMRDLWKTSKTPEADLKVKTAEYVKKMMEEYTSPEATSRPPLKIKPY